MMPEASNIVEARERAGVCSDGVKAVESAGACDLKAIAGAQEGKING